MEYIRLIHPRNFDHVKGRFNDLAFKNSRGGGVSVIELDCAAKASDSLICAHLRKFYPEISGEPPIYYILKTRDLPGTQRIEQVASPSGDECHHNIHDVSDRWWDKYRKGIELKDYNICDGDGPRELTISDLERLRR